MVLDFLVIYYAVFSEEFYTRMVLPFLCFVQVSVLLKVSLAFSRCILFFGPSCLVVNIFLFVTAVVKV